MPKSNDLENQVKELESIVSFYANASPQSILSDAGGKALGYFANRDTTAGMYQKVNEIKKDSSSTFPRADIQFLLGIVEVHRRGIGTLVQALEAIKPSLSMLEQERINYAYEELNDLCAGLMSNKKTKAKKKSKSK